MTVAERLGEIIEKEYRGIYARLVHSLGDFDLAEDALQDAISAALTQWADEGIPDNPHAWLYRVARFKGIDAIRRKGRFAQVEDLKSAAITQDPEPEEIGDEVLRLIFTCCHPALSGEAQIALTLREVCGLTTEEIASAFLVPAPTVAQRIVRAKTKIREAKIPLEVPSGAEMAERLDAVLRTIYLVFNEGYSATSGDEVVRRDLVVEAIRLGRLLAELLAHAEVLGLLAMMLLSQSRIAARTSPDGQIILLEHQDRTAWDGEAIAEGGRLVTQAIRLGDYGGYTLQAAISAVHCDAPSYEETDWNEIVGLYDALLRVEPSPVVELNRAVAMAMRDGPNAGIPLIEPLMEQLSDYHLAHGARAELHRRAGHHSEAARDYRRALELVGNDPVRQLLLTRLAEVEGVTASG